MVYGRTISWTNSFFSENPHDDKYDELLPAVPRQSAKTTTSRYQQHQLSLASGLKGRICGSLVPGGVASVNEIVLNANDRDLHSKCDEDRH